MAEAIVKAAASHFGTLLINEVKSLWVVKDKVKRLQDELIMASSFLRDAESQKHHTSEVIRATVSKIRDVAYEAEDIIEKYCFKESNKTEGGISDSIKWVCCHLCNLHEAGSNIDELMDKLKELTSQLQRYNILPKSNEGTTTNRPLNRTFSFSQVDDTIGLDNDTNTLVNYLLHENIYSVISIYGMGGLGKSTLAKKAFKDPNVTNRFNKCAWVFVSQQFQEADVLKSILTKLCRADGEQMRRIQNLRDDMLHGELHEILHNNECLVVLDDIWRVEDWNRIQPAFHSIHTSSSKLIITTRNDKLLSDARPRAFLHQLQLLNEDDSLELLRRTILPDVTIAPDTKMERMGTHMVKRCRGLPLAIVALGGLLRNKTTVGEWKDVHDNMNSYLNKSDLNLVVSEVLELSYNDLPHHLRPCFLYMSCFPEDFQIPFKRLWHLWRAENFLMVRTKNSEDVARDYLNQLVQRCLVQVGTLTQSKKIKTCHLHDMMRDMCMRKATEEDFLHVFGQNGNIAGNHQMACFNSRKRGTTLHRLAMHLVEKSSSKFDYDAIGDYAHMRLLMAFNSFPGDFINVIVKLGPLLRILDLEGIIIDVIPKEIEQAVHLRYLSLKDTNLREVSSLIGELRFLEFLDLRTYQPWAYRRESQVNMGPNMVNETKLALRRSMKALTKMHKFPWILVPKDYPKMVLPNVLWKMKRLIHLYLPRKYKSDDGKAIKLSGLTSLETLSGILPLYTQMEDILVMTKLKRIKFSSLEDEEALRMDVILEFAARISSKCELKELLSIHISNKMLGKDPDPLAQLPLDPTLDFSSCQLHVSWIDNLYRLVLPTSITA